MFAIGMGPVADSAFAITSMLIAIPTGIKIFSWIATVWGGSLRMTTAMYFALAFILEFTIGGLTGIMFASPPVDLQQTDSYFIVAHFHYVLFGGVAFAIFGAFYYWWPKMTGRMLDERLGKLEFWLTVIGFNGTFFPMHILGQLGHAAAHLYLRARHGLDVHQSVRDGVRVHPRARVSGAVHQHHQEPHQWRARARRSVGWTRAGMGDHLAAAAVQLRQPAQCPRTRSVLDHEIWTRGIARRRDVCLRTNSQAGAGGGADRADPHAGAVVLSDS